MKELSLNILDIAVNSVNAGAKNVEICVDESVESDVMLISVSDDGCGMDKNLLESVTDPFTTTRQTRKVGLGIPLFKMAAEMAGGGLTIESEENRGTCVCAKFKLSHLNRAPLGNMADTITSLVMGSPETDFIYRHRTGKGTFEFSTSEARAVLGDVAMNEPAVIKWIDGYVAEGEAEIS